MGQFRLPSHFARFPMIFCGTQKKQMLRKKPCHFARRTWAIALKRLRPDPRFVADLATLHHGYRSALSRERLTGQLRALGKLFREYALQQPEFAALSPGDRRRLLCRNTPLFVQVNDA